MSAPANPKAAKLADLLTAPNGLDTIRLIAASAVIVSHAFPLTGAEEPLYRLTGQASIGTLAVSAFFLISGFLVTASYARSSPSRYAEKRVRRIMPALVVAVLVSAFVIGPAYTRLTIGEYLASSQLWRFIGNAAFLPVGYGLPGVFEDRPISAVNGSLWSLKYEAACYVLVPLAMVLARWRIAAVTALWLASFAISRAIPDGTSGPLLIVDLASSLFRFFGMGMLLYFLADRIPLRSAWAWIAALATVLAALTPVFVETAVIAGSYALLVFAAKAPRRFRELTASGDISYGVYVYAFPIQQMLVPLSIASGAAAWLANTAMAVPLAMLAGWLSWRLVEKPFLSRQRRKVSARDA